MTPRKHRRAHPSWRPGHEKVLAELFADPRLSVAECAKRCGYSRWQVSRIRNSPEFQRRYAALQARAVPGLLDRRLALFAGKTAG